MVIGRFGVVVPVLVMSGLFAGKKITPPSASTFPTHGVLFSILLIGVILIVGALTFFPALGLGPIVEYLLMIDGRRI
jgi:K+-transporting ATPase ATPase A chain